MRLSRSFAALSLVIVAACGKEGAMGTGATTGTGAGAGATTGTGAGASGGAAGAGGAMQDGLTARITATPASGAGPLTVMLSGCASTAETGEIVLYTWDFGDGTTGTGPVVQHVFSQGNPNVKLTITGSTRASASAAQAIAVSGPTPRNLVADPTGHPRLYFDAAHLTELEQRIAATSILGTPGYKKSYVAGFLLDQSSAWEAAHWYLTNGACTGLLGSAFTSTNSDPVSNSREISDCVTTLAAGAALETDATTATSYANAAIAAMVHMADVWPEAGVPNAGFGRWDCGACSTGGSNLNNGELLYAVATSFDLLYTQMSAQDRADVLGLLLREARFAYTASLDPTTWWTTDSGNNWRAVVHGGLGVAALAVEGEAGLMPGEAKTWITRAVTQIEDYLDNNYDADGANYEDAAHFGYGLSFATQFFFTLKNVTGEDDFGYKGQILQKAARYRVFATEGNFDGIMPNDEASPDPTTYTAELLLASRYRDGFAQWAWDRVSGASRPAANSFPFKVGGNGDQSQLLETALCYDDTVAVESPEGRLPLGAVYPTFGRALFRSDWDDPNGLTLAAESGVYGSHGHPNQGHFFLTGYGGTLLTQKSEGGGSGDFNVVRVDGQDQVEPGGAITEHSLLSTTDASLVAPLVDHVRFDTKAAYTASLDHAFRDFLFVLPAGGAGGYAVVFDDLGAAASHTWATELHFASGLALAQKGAGHYQASGGGVAVDAFLIEPAGAKESTTDGLAVSASGSGATFVTLLYPSNATNAPPAVTAVPGGGASGFSIGSDTVLHNPAGQPFTQGMLASDGIVVMARGAAPAFSLVGLYGGTTLSVGGETWLSATAQVDAVMTPGADGVRVWVSGASGSKVDLKVLAGKGPAVISIDDQLSGFAEPDGSGLVTVAGLDVSKAHAIVIGSATASPPGCN